MELCFCLDASIGACVNFEFGDRDQGFCAVIGLVEVYTVFDILHAIDKNDGLLGKEGCLGLGKIDIIKIRIGAGGVRLETFDSLISAANRQYAVVITSSRSFAHGSLLEDRIIDYDLSVTIGGDAINFLIC